MTAPKVTAATQEPGLAPQRRRGPLVGRIISAVLVFRLELRPPRSLDAGLILLAWLRRPAIEMPLSLADRQTVNTDGERLRRRLNEIYPF